MVTLDQALDHMRGNCDLTVVAGTAWSDGDISAYESKTGLLIPETLKTVLTRIGHCAVEQNDAFMAEYADGSRSVHESQILVNRREYFLTMLEMFTTGDPWPDQFTLPMVFFGTADAGHSYLLMDGKDPDNSSVYLWERATDPFGTGNNARGLGIVAPTLAEFFHGLDGIDEVTRARTA